jgi:hypothetical protein
VSLVLVVMGLAVLIGIGLLIPVEGAPFGR